MDLDNQIAALQADLNNAHHVTYLTGAGVSTPSHIPDYRSKNGIYNGISESPEQILSEDTLFHEPAKFHHFVMENILMLSQILFTKKLQLAVIKMAL